LAAARAPGRSVPDDLSVVGFDDLPVAARVYPRLSSVRQEKQAIGSAMAARLVDRIEGRVQGAPERIVLPTSYVARDSAARAGSRVSPSAPSA